MIPQVIPAVHPQVKQYFGVNYTDPHQCASDCAKDAKCKAWVYVAKRTRKASDQLPDATDNYGYQVPRCCLKSEIDKRWPVASTAAITSGVMVKPGPPGPVPQPGAQWLLTTDTTLSGAIPGHKNSFPVASKAFKLLQALDTDPKQQEQELTLRVVVDRSIIEAFAQGGRAVLTATGRSTHDLCCPLHVERSMIP